MRDREYDRFGPWVMEISNDDPLPSIFASSMQEEEIPLFSIKIPRPEERRELKPGMNLYNSVVALYRTDLQILERVGDDVHSVSVPYSDIAALKQHENLLEGHLLLYLPEHVHDIPYNTVSHDIIQKVSTFIRKRNASFLEKEIPVWHGAVTDRHHGEISYYFTRLLSNLGKDNPEMKVLAVQGTVKMVSRGNNFIRRLFYGAIEKKLLESLHLTNGRELEIISRGRMWGYRWQSDYCRETLFIPLEKIKKGDCLRMSSDNGIETVTFKTAESSHTFLFTSENPDLMSYLNFL